MDADVILYFSLMCYNALANFSIGRKRGETRRYVPPGISCVSAC